MPQFALEEFTPSFFVEAPAVARHTVTLPVSADTLWAELTGDRPLHWCRLLHRGHYTTPAPHSVGTLRSMGAGGGLLRLREVFLTWDDEQRTHSFMVSHANLPGFRRFGEHYRVDEAGEHCRFSWTIAAQARPGAGLLYPVVHRVARSLMADTVRHFAAQSTPSTTR